jgi:outer membrane protein OmpA-like peptidoglycan-associated protein
MITPRRKVKREFKIFLILLLVGGAFLIFYKSGIIKSSLKKDEPIISNNTKEYYLRLEKLLSQSQNKNKQILLIGFTDNTGNPDKNIILSNDRAKSVKSILETEGIGNIKTKGFGATKSLNENITENQRKVNRRVEVWLSDND